jgi:hypothetical protein
MKKLLTILLSLVLITSAVFGATETASFTLSATVAESALNSGLRIISGDKSSVITGPGTFDTVFGSALNAITIDVGEEVSTGDVEGYFTVLVRRLDANPITVSINATPMQKVDGALYYLGYKITRVGSTEAIINTIVAPNTVSSGITYSANTTIGGVIKDYAVFKYEVPQNNLVPFGKYTTNVYFTITIT